MSFSSSAQQRHQSRPSNQPLKTLQTLSSQIQAQPFNLRILKSRFALSALLLAGMAMVIASQSIQADEMSYGVGTKAADQWLMAKYDTNGDSVISAGEISQKRERMFSAMDDNGDGIVSLDEYELLDIKKRALIVKARFTKLDKNGDGQLTDDEYVSYYGSFGALDLDGDGKITSAEMRLDPKASAAPTLQASADPKCFLWLCVRASVN
jgi:hypothetical protein